MGEFFALQLLVVGFISSLIFLFRSKLSLVIKLINSFILLVFFIIILSLLIKSGWEKGSESREVPTKAPDDPKTIYFFNNTNKTINVIIDCKYAKEEIIKHSNIKSYYNKIDTINNLRKGEKSFSDIAIPYSDTIINFPENFNIKITDSVGKVIKTYNKKSFFMSISHSQYTNIDNIGRKEKSWHLLIK